MDRPELKKMAHEVRKGILTSIYSAKAGHPGGSLSAAELFTYLYFEELNVDPKNPQMEDRDRFVLSKGHTAPGLYAALAHRGFFPVEDLETLRHTGTSGYEMCARRRYVDGFFRTGIFGGSRNGACSQNGSKGLSCICSLRRRRNSGRPDMGSGYVCGASKIG